MTYQLIKKLLSIGNILAMTPSSIESREESYWRKTRAVIIFTLLTLGTVFSLIKKNFYQDSIHISVVVSAITDLALFISNFYVIIVFNFWKRKQWYHLLKNLKTIEDHCCFVTSAKNRITAETVLLAHFAVFSLSIYVIYFWYGFMKMRYFEQHSVRIVESYIQFFYKLLLSVILDMFYVRYKALNRLLKTTKKPIPQLEEVRKIQYLMCFMKRNVEIFNNLFGWLLFLILTQTTFQVISYMGFLIFFHGGFEMLVVVLISLSLNLGMTVMMIFMADLVVREAEKIVPLTFELRWSLKNGTIEEKIELYGFTNLIVKNLPEFTAANFFILKKSTILHILSTFSTFLIIMLQFAEK